VADAVDGGAATPDSVALAAGVEASEAAVSLARLELLGYLRVDGAGRYERTTMKLPDEESSTTLRP
jgi:hypothetical protein